MIFGIGTDIIEVGRIRKQISKTGNLKESLFTKAEIEYCESKHDNARHYAARFAAKEAFLKALGTGLRDGFSFREIEVLSDNLGRPEIKVYGKVKKFTVYHKLIYFNVSITHVKDYANAMVIIEKAD
ncbi:MAG: holo-ACP synthase [Bacteroidia bacterium]|nr:holo-ACP synthase [Bacteroidia bacterium]